MGATLSASQNTEKLRRAVSGGGEAADFHGHAVSPTTALDGI